MRNNRAAQIDSERNEEISVACVKAAGGKVKVVTVVWLLLKRIKFMFIWVNGLLFDKTILIVSKIDFVCSWALVCKS